MYQITCDGYTIYDPRFPDYVVGKAELLRELNKADSLTFTVYPNHPNFAALRKLKSDIVVYDGSDVVFRGRILDETIGWLNEVTFVCESPLAWLNDTIQRPFQFPVDPEHSTPADYLSFLITRHNQQEPSNRQIAVGSCTVEDPNGYIVRSDTEYSTTFQLLNEGLLDTLGGYFIMRYTANGATIDYLSDFSVQANQPIRFGLNLLSLSTAKKGDSIVTAILPLGAQDEETGLRLNISEIADGSWDDVYKYGDIVYSSTAESIYGARIVETVIWDDVTVASNLVTKAREELAKAILAPQTVSITAADLSRAGYQYNTFSLGTYVVLEDNAHATAHGLEARYLVSKLSLNLLDPASNKLTLGATTASLVDGQRTDLVNGMKAVEANVSMETSRQVRDLEIRNQSAIERSENGIRLYVAENTYTKGEVDDLVGEVSTSLTQTADEFRFNFTQMQQNIDDVQAGADAEFSAIYSYISFQGGEITLGKSDSEITLKIQNDMIGIYRSGVLLTYWQANKQYTPSDLEVPVGGKVTLGNYAFIPRSNGSLDFTWVGE